MNRGQKFLTAFLVLLGLFHGITGSLAQTAGSPAVATNKQAQLAAYLDKVYQTMDDHYYLPVNRAIYDDFLKNYTSEKLEAFNKKSKQTDNFIHLGAGLLVNKLKSPKDKITVFIPPKKVKEFKSKAYAVTEDLGIEGVKTPQGFEISKVQKHCQAFTEGVRIGDIIQKIAGHDVKAMAEEAIREKLKPELGSKTTLTILFIKENAVRDVILESKSYFRETVSVEPSPIKGVLVLKIEHFNQATSGDFSDELAAFGPNNIQTLVLDLRNNEGGPPLAAREILGYFMPMNDHLFAIARKKQKPVMMTAPSKPVAYKGPAYVLVNQKTGSAAEMFSGVMQAKKVAQLVGQPTAGATYLKSLYDFDDKSTIFMITSLTFFFDKRVFPDTGLTPDIVPSANEDALETVFKTIRANERNSARL